MVDGDDFPVLAPDQLVLATMSFVEAPIQFFVLFHKATREEFEEIRKVVSFSLENGTCERELVDGIHKRFEFLKLAYKYYFATENEVVFSSQDALIENATCTYSLEHKSIDSLFDSVFHSLNILIENEEYLNNPLQELLSCIYILKTSVSNHMMKKERQVFPLLMQQFSSIQQASLIWRFMCSIPITLLMNVFPWMTSFLSPAEQVNLQLCIKEVIPKDAVLQEVVLSWLTNKNRPMEGYPEYGEAAHFLPKFKELPKRLHIKNANGIWRKAYLLQNSMSFSPFAAVSFCHEAIKKDFKEILEDLNTIRRSSNYVDLASVIAQLKFLADFLTFYSNALEKISDPVFKEVTNDGISLSDGFFCNGSQVEDLQRLLHYNYKNEVPLCKFVEKLCWEVESFLKRITKQFAFQESEIFPLIRKNYNHEAQQHILYTSLHNMSLGLLKCAATWFSSHLSEDQSMSVLVSIKQGCSLVNKSFASLLFEWVRIGYTNKKTCVENFRKDMHNMFETKCLFLPNQFKENTVSSSVHFATQPYPFDKSNMFECSTLYSSGLNKQIHFSKRLYLSCTFPKVNSDYTNEDSISQLEPSPMDYIFFFHKALKKDLECLVFDSSQLAESVGNFVDFQKRFHLAQFMYQLHSDAEDEIAFPALEAKKIEGQNISNSYISDHKIEANHFKEISLLLDEIFELHNSISCADMDKYRNLCMKLHDMCKTMKKTICDHINYEEFVIWPLFEKCFSSHEQEKLIGHMLGRTRAEILQEMIPWIMAYLTQGEQEALMSTWRKVTKNTMFDDWLREWWLGMKQNDVINPTDSNTILIPNTDPLELVSTYLSKEGSCDKITQNNSTDVDVEMCGTHEEQDKENVPEGHECHLDCLDCDELFREGAKKRSKMVTGQHLQVRDNFKHQEKVLSMSQEDLEATIRRVSRDSSLDPKKKSLIIQNLLMSRWTMTQQQSSQVIQNADETLGRCPSYRDPLKQIFGCEHYKRNCKLLASCCDQLYACRNCHDAATDHSMDRKATTKMMCMKCLIVQPIGPTCSTISCGNLSMAKYYCKICKLFDDERDIYHCPYCNLCRVGKGLGIDYFHCMICNACMSRSLSVHVCREKSFEDNCPICHEDIFTSSSPIKALPCGHMMHSTCFQEYTCTHYTCPICSKSLGDMQVYFGMLDAMLAEEKMPDEHSGRTQVILCNDCEKRGTAPHHWMYHKCSSCGSYNTRLL